jgi:hypothetical protein
MTAHRTVLSCTTPLIQSFDAPFSVFSFAEKFSGGSAFHRCFSLARSFLTQTLVIETIPSVGILEEENEEICALGYALSKQPIYRFSFWSETIGSASEIQHLQSKQLIGYVILKCDQHIDSHGQTQERWHVFEAVFQKYQHDHNCVPRQVSYPVRVGEVVFEVRGVLYCQQNALNKACAHVAMRSLISRIVKEGDVSYAWLNRVARQATEGGVYCPRDGLTPLQIRAVFDALGVKYRDMDYSGHPQLREIHPYQKYLYAGIESGYGGLLGFKMDGPEAHNDRHIIPFYGHTFNKDTWVPDAQISYFNIGGKVGYIPSESWTSSFIGHDDNFGANFCVPRLYAKPENVEYVVELFGIGVQYSGVTAEVLGLQFLYSLCPYMTAATNIWVARLNFYSHPSRQRVVLRALSVSSERYIEHLRTIQDWDGNRENIELIDLMTPLLPKMLWIVEVSLPHLFPANEHKLGEIVLDATRVPDEEADVDFNLFVFARLPKQYIVNTKNNSNKPDFASVPSFLCSHVELIKQL